DRSSAIRGGAVAMRPNLGDSPGAIMLARRSGSATVRRVRMSRNTTRYHPEFLLPSDRGDPSRVAYTECREGWKGVGMGHRSCTHRALVHAVKYKMSSGTLTWTGITAA